MNNVTPGNVTEDYEFTYCPAHVAFTQVWVAHAFNRCFFDTVEAVLLVTIMGVCGTIELKTYYKYSTPVDPRMLGSPPRGYIIQLCLSAFLLVINGLRFGLRFVSRVYGYMILRDFAGVMVWGMSGLLIYVERNYDLPTITRGHHSIYLILIWAVALLTDTLYLINVRGLEWFFALENMEDYIMFTLFLLVWISELALLILGLRAPGMLSYLQRQQFIYRPLNSTRDKYGSFSGPCSSTATSVLELSMGTSTFHQSIDALRADLMSGDLVAAFHQLHRQNPQLTTDIGRHVANEGKNRYYNVLPYDHNRLVLRPDTAASLPDNMRTGVGDDYINASWVSVRVADIDLQHVYICTQAPKPDTINSFWHMIWQERVPVIVMLTDTVENGVPKCDPYWPQLNDTLELRGNRVVVSCTAVQQPSRSRPYSVRELFLVDVQSRDQLSCSLYQLHQWPDQGTPKQGRRFCDMMRAIRARMPDMASYQEKPTPIVVHCTAGVGRTGAYILLETLLSNIDAESPLRPIEVVESLRSQRMAMVQTDDQLTFSVATALHYFDHR